MRWLFDHVEARERRRDAAFPSGVAEGADAQRALRRSAWGRGLAVLGALGVIGVVGVGPTPDSPPLAVVAVVSLLALVVGLVLWGSAAARLARRELEVRRSTEEG